MNRSLTCLAKAYPQVIKGEFVRVEAESMQRAKYLIAEAQKRLAKYKGFLDKNEFTILLSNSGMLMIRPPGEKYAGDIRLTINKLEKFRKFIAPEVNENN